jgi:membrane associated rhomboid family serine protease
MRSLFPKPPTVVGKLLLINIVIFLAMLILPALAKLAYTWFAVSTESVFTVIQLWRPITYQFLHDTSGLGHIFGNMLGLYFFGSLLERQWGQKKFLIFYLTCGAVGGILYSLLALIGLMDRGILIGASGAVFGIVAAVAITYPRLRVYVWGVFPIPMGVLALMYVLLIFLGLRSGRNAGGEVAHLAGMAVGAFYVLSASWRENLKRRFKSSMYEKQRTAERRMQIEVDRILKKVHDQGIHSLNAAEKRTLKRASEREQSRRK